MAVSSNFYDYMTLTIYRIREAVLGQFWNMLQTTGRIRLWMSWICLVQMFTVGCSPAAFCCQSIKKQLIFRVVWEFQCHFQQVIWTRREVLLQNIFQVRVISDYATTHITRAICRMVTFKTSPQHFFGCTNLYCIPPFTKKSIKYLQSIATNTLESHNILPFFCVLVSSHQATHPMTRTHCQVRLVYHPTWCHGCHESHL